MGDSTVDANNAKIAQIYQDELQYAKDQADVDYARNMGSFAAGQGIRDAGNAGVAAINYLQDWQKYRDMTEENKFAVSQGLDAPNVGITDLSGYATNTGEDNWQKANDALNGTTPDEMNKTQGLMDQTKKTLGI